MCLAMYCHSPTFAANDISKFLNACFTFISYHIWKRHLQFRCTTVVRRYLKRPPFFEGATVFWGGHRWPGGIRPYTTRMYPMHMYPTTCWIRRGRLTPIYVGGLDYYWSWQWLAAFPAPSHCLNQGQISFYWKKSETSSRNSWVKKNSLNNVHAWFV